MFRLSDRRLAHENEELFHLGHAVLVELDQLSFGDRAYPPSAPGSQLFENGQYALQGQFQRFSRVDFQFRIEISVAAECERSLQDFAHLLELISKLEVFALQRDHLKSKETSYRKGRQQSSELTSGFAPYFATEVKPLDVSILLAKQRSSSTISRSSREGVVSSPIIDADNPKILGLLSENQRLF